MGGYGSGRSSCRQKAGDCRSLDIDKLNRSGCLVDGRSGNWVWTRDDSEIGRVEFYMANGDFVLIYRAREWGGEWQSVTQKIGLTFLHCNYGGQRPYFRCPGVVNGRHCMRRVGKLFLGGRFFLCRHCYDLAYSSQSEPKHERLLRRANKLRMNLGGNPGAASFIASKPKGTWHRTYQRKCFEIEWCEAQADQLFLSKFSHLLGGDELVSLVL